MEQEDTRPPVEAGLRPACANCGAMVEGRYCPSCGQPARSPVGPFREAAGHAVRSFLDWDERLLGTVRRLLFRPGRLALAWCRGRRQSQVGPFRLYLLCSVVYFVVAGWSGTTSFLFVNLTGQEAQAQSAFVQWLPRAMFAVVPGFALLAMWLFDRTRFYIEHLVLALHVHSAWYLLATVPAVVDPLVAARPRESWGALLTALAFLGAAIQLAALVYMALALRRFYGRAWPATLLRAFALMVGYSFMLGLATVGILAIVAL